MLEAYFDESGTHDASDAVSVGGFLASREEWVAFAIAWKAMLERESIKVFHRSDLECFQNEFIRENGWDEARRDRVVNKAQTIIGDCTHESWHVAPHGANDCLVALGYKHAAPPEQRQVSQVCYCR